MAIFLEFVCFALPLLLTPVTNYPRPRAVRPDGRCSDARLVRARVRNSFADTV
jgi:hypothetical protein